MSQPIFNETNLARVFVLGVVVVGWLTWSLEIEPGEIRLIPCPFRTVTGIDCPGCGMTRACTAVGQGQLGEAWHYHPLAFVLLGLAVVVAVAPKSCGLFWNRLSSVWRVLIIASGFLVVFGVWLMRLGSQLVS